MVCRFPKMSPIYHCWISSTGLTLRMSKKDMYFNGLW